VHCHNDGVVDYEEGIGDEEVDIADVAYEMMK